MNGQRIKRILSAGDGKSVGVIETWKEKMAFSSPLRGVEDPSGRFKLKIPP